MAGEGATGGGKSAANAAVPPAATLNATTHANHFMRIPLTCRVPGVARPVTSGTVYRSSTPNTSTAREQYDILPHPNCEVQLKHLLKVHSEAAMISAAACSGPPMTRMVARCACSGGSLCHAMIASSSVGKSGGSAVMEGPGRLPSRWILSSSLIVKLAEPLYDRRDIYLRFSCGWLIRRSSISAEILLSHSSAWSAFSRYDSSSASSPAIRSWAA